MTDFYGPRGELKIEGPLYIHKNISYATDMFKHTKLHRAKAAILKKEHTLCSSFCPASIFSSPVDLWVARS